MLPDIRDTPAGTGPDAPSRAGPMRFALAAKTRWRAMFLAAGAVLTLLGVVLASGAVLILGVVLLLVALLHGLGASGCTSADSRPGGPGAGKALAGVSPGHAHIRHVRCGQGPADGARLAPECPPRPVR